MDGTSASLSDRVDLLERRCSRLRLWCVLLLSVALTACLSSALRPSPDVIEAKSFVVKGPDGKVRGRLGGDEPESQRGLVLYSENGDESASLSVFDGTVGNDKGSVLAVLQLEAGDDQSRIFSAFASEKEAGSVVSDEKLTIQSSVKSGRSSIEFKKVDEPEPAKQDDSDESQEYPIMRLGVSNDEPSIEGLTRKGEVIFKQPQPK